MKSIEDKQLEEWLDLAADGALEGEERLTFEAALAVRDDLRQEAAALATLHAQLDADRIPVRHGFTDQVVSSLASAPWEARHSWRLPLALSIGLAAAAAVVFALAGDGSFGVFGTLAAVGDFFQVTLLAGAGLLGATWSGITLAVDELFAGARSGIAALVVAVVLLDVLFLRLLRRTAKAPAGRPDSNTPRGGADAETDDGR